MSEHRAIIEWVAQANDFEGFSVDSYRRDHLIRFENGVEIQGSAAPAFLGNPECVDPESLLVAALSNCHMLTFLAVANKQKIKIARYLDHAVGILEKNSDGKMAVTKVTLKPHIEFAGDNIPSMEQVWELHEKAHKACMIANSVKTEVYIEAQ